MGTIITLIVLIASVVVYFAARKYQRRATVLYAHKIKTELFEKLSEIRTLQTHFLSIYGSEKVMRALADSSGDVYDKLLIAAEAFKSQLIECEKLHALLSKTDEDSLDATGMQEMLIWIDEEIRNYRNKLNHLPPQIRNILKGEG